MRIRELSERTGMSVATIKYYIREGLLPPGDRISRTQADYDQSHVARLELIRALREGAGLSIATLSRVFKAMAAAREDLRHEYLGIAVASLTPPIEVSEEEEDHYTAAANQVDALLDYLGWDTDPTSPAARQLAWALMHIHRYLPGLVDSPTDLLPYAEAVRSLAGYEIPDSYDPTGDPESALSLAVLGTALFEPVLLGLRKLAHIDRVRRLTTG